jgi:hypothetical protein
MDIELWDLTLRLWEIETGRELSRIDGHDDVTLEQDGLSAADRNAHQISDRCPRV